MGNEVVLKFDLNVKGLAYHEYEGNLNIRQAQQKIKERILKVLHAMGDLDILFEDIAIY